jgi:dipeptidyl aminopeptidase/acylaminoacyl peptidase
MRADEVLSLNVVDVILDRGREGLLIRESKNNRQRIVVLTSDAMPKTLTCLRSWLPDLGADVSPTMPLFCSNRGNAKNLELYIMDRDGKNVRQLTKAPGCYNGGPFFSPDGKRVIFRSDRKKKDHLQIYVINADGTGERALTDDLNWVHWAPYWYKDGRHIIYTAADHSEIHFRRQFAFRRTEIDRPRRRAPVASVRCIAHTEGQEYGNRGALATRVNLGGGRFSESTVIEFGTNKEVLFSSALPVEFADKLRIKNPDGTLDIDVSVVAVQYDGGKTAVAARFLNEVPNWIVKL